MLIDYVLTDKDIIREIASYWKTVLVPDFVFDEVQQLTFKKAVELGLCIVETPLAEISTLPGLSLPDSTCLYHVRN